MSVGVKRGLLAAALISGAAAFVTGTSGCLSVKKEFQDEQARREAIWRQQHAADKAPAPAVNLTWKDALVRLRAGNEKVRATDLDLLRAEENLKQIRRSLIPQLSFYGSYNQALFNGPHIDPFSFASSVFFDVPGMVGYRLRQETAQLAIIRAQLAQEAVWREKVTDLYRSFYRSAELSATRRTISSALALAAGPGSETFRAELQRRLLSTAADQADASAAVGDLLGSPGTIFACLADDLPVLGYDHAATRPPADRLAKLPLQLAAVELVGMHARELGVNLQYWPDLNLFVTSPAVYSRYGGRDRFWSSDDFYAGASAYWTLDTRGSRKSQKRILAVETRLRREALENESLRVSQRIQIALTALAGTDDALAALDNATASAGSGPLQNAAAARRAALNNDRREWKLVIWFFDDTRWPGVPPLPAPTPALAALSK